MKEKTRNKYVVGIILALLLLSPALSALTIPEEQKQSTVASVSILNSITNTKENKKIDMEELKLLLELINNPLDKQRYQEQLQGKLETLETIDLISKETAQDVYHCFIRSDQTEYSPTPKALFFDAMNLFNGIFFGIKGNLQNTVFNLPVFQFPFFDDNITALFIGYSKAVGAGSVFTLGTLGFKYIYDYDKNAYEFPYFSDLTGNLIGFTGILIEVTVGNLVPEEYRGTYLIGVGMSIFTLWNKE